MTDQMGMVYYGNYLELFEIGRTEYFRAHGLDYRQMEADGYLLPVAHASCDYLNPARFDDLLEIATRVVDLTRAKIHFAYEIRRKDETDLLTRGVTHHVFLSPQGRIRRLDPQWWSRLQSAGLNPDP
jgi:acyl-CoA thioester hydrolase